jgi:hypothetical protein
MSCDPTPWPNPRERTGLSSPTSRAPATASSMSRAAAVASSPSRSQQTLPLARHQQIPTPLTGPSPSRAVSRSLCRRRDHAAAAVPRRLLLPHRTRRLSPDLFSFCVPPACMANWHVQEAECTGIRVEIHVPPTCMANCLSVRYMLVV